MGNRVEREVPHADVLALEGDALRRRMRPQLLQQLYDLPLVGDALAVVLDEGHVVRLVLRLQPARAERADDAPLRDLVERREHLRQHSGVAEARVEHSPGETNAARHRPDRRHQRERLERPLLHVRLAVVVDQVVAEPDGVEALPVGCARLLQDRACGGGRRGIDEHADLCHDVLRSVDFRKPEPSLRRFANCRALNCARSSIDGCTTRRGVCSPLFSTRIRLRSARANSDGRCSGIDAHVGRLRGRTVRSESGRIPVVVLEEREGRYEGSSQARRAARGWRRRDRLVVVVAFVGSASGARTAKYNICGVLLQLEPVRDRAVEGRTGGGQGPRRQRHGGHPEQRPAPAADPAAGCDHDRQVPGDDHRRRSTVTGSARRSSRRWPRGSRSSSVDYTLGTLDQTKTLKPTPGLVSTVGQGLGSEQITGSGHGAQAGLHRQGRGGQAVHASRSCTAWPTTRPTRTGSAC